MATTLVATPEPGHNPPRMLLELTYTGQTSATITRNDPDGKQIPVRRAEPASLDGAGSWVGYDYESWFGADTTYTAATAAGAITSTEVTLDVDQVWLRHPGTPSLSQAIDFQGEGEPVRPVVQSVIEPLGRRTPIVISDGQRKSKRGELTLRTKTIEEHGALLALLDNVTPLLLDVPPDCGWGVDLAHLYLSVGDLTERRFRPDYYPQPWRSWVAPYIVVGRPAGDLQAERTYATVLAAHSSYQDVLNYYSTYSNLLTGYADGPGAPIEEFTFLTRSAPDRTEVYDNKGLAAVFTNGSRTVSLRGPSRTFADEFKPYVDEFLRERPADHGQSPGGGTWVRNGGTLATEYSVDGAAAKTILNTPNVSRRSIVNAVIRYPDLRARITIDAVPTGTGALVSSCVTFGYSGTSNHYLGRIAFLENGSVTTRIDKLVSGTQTSLTSSVTVGAAGTFTPGQKWWIRAQVAPGNIVRTKVWLDGTSQPGTWTLSVTDSSFPEGKVGRRDFATNDVSNLPITASCDWFEVTSAEIVNATSVTDNQYVHLLSEPFSGPASAQTTWLRARLSDPLTGDLRKVMWQYVNGQPPVMDPDEPDLQIAGDADYGPLYNVDRSFDLDHDSDGTRQEGADFNDYLGKEWTYANGDVDPPEAHQFRCIDCSGFVRMVMCYRGGFPPTTDTTPNGLPFEDDPDRTAIPRVSFNIANNGPGVFVAVGNPNLPDLSNIMIGDVVCFDADQSNEGEEEGQIDHVGFYFGRDQFGNYVFISSRKTVSGPTIGFLGGASILNGTGLYSRTLTKIRRL